MAKFIVTWEQFQRLVPDGTEQVGWWDDTERVREVGGAVFADSVSAAKDKGEPMELIPLKRVQSP